MADEWDHLPFADSVLLAGLVLKFFVEEGFASHRVFKDAAEVAKLRGLDEMEFAQALPQIGITQTRLVANKVRVRAITLYGVGFKSKTLGVESFSISPNGQIEMKPRHVLSQRPLLSEPTGPQV